MKIIFLCGSLEPGRDGVGDYIRRLAGNLISQGHNVSAIALFDKYVQEEFSGTQQSDSACLGVFRFPIFWSDKNRLSKAKDLIQDIKPHWLSLQYVPFSFHAKGLPFKLSRQIKSLGVGIRWHIMFHELWVGMNEDAPLKMELWGLIQKQLIKLLVHNLNPQVVHTHSQLYQVQLAKIGLDAQLLPLFSNIPVLVKIKRHIQTFSEESTQLPLITFVIFGGIHPGAPMIQFANEAAIYSKRNNTRIVLKLIGRLGKEMYKWVSAWTGAGMEVDILSEKKEIEISECLAHATFGISTTPFALNEKSGSVAAMIEHGLPTICVAKDWKLRGIDLSKFSFEVFEYKIGNFEACISAIASSGKSPVEEVSKRFLESLLI